MMNLDTSSAPDRKASDPDLKLPRKKLTSGCFDSSFCLVFPLFLLVPCLWHPHTCSHGKRERERKVTHTHTVHLPCVSQQWTLFPPKLCLLSSRPFRSWRRSHHFQCQIMNMGFDSAVIVLTSQGRCVCVCACVCWIPDSPRGSRSECSTAVFHFDTLIDSEPFPSHCAPLALPLCCTSHYCCTKGDHHVGKFIEGVRSPRKATRHVAFFRYH